MNPWLVGGVALAAAVIGGKAAMQPKLQHFAAGEFGLWYPLMNQELLLKLDAFREAWGAPVEISKAAGSLGRHGGDAGSQHNVDRWGKVNAVDTFPKVPDGVGGYRYIETAQERNRAYQIALSVGFTGIGIYTDTTPGNLLHVDVRQAERVATWSRVAGEYKGLYEVLA